VDDALLVRAGEGQHIAGLTAAATASATAADAGRVAALRALLAPARDPASPAVKEELRANTDAAIARGVFGVPTLELDGRLYWGLDSLPMVAAALRGDPWFDGPEWERAAAPRPGVARPH
jgi:2-hydroxychromene-2-carboxylate isomerase